MVNKENVGRAGINIGYGHTKLRTDEQYLQYATVYHEADKSMSGLMGSQERNTLSVEVEGIQYEVGADAALLSINKDVKTVFEHWGDSLQYRIFMQTVLDILAQEREGEWRVVVGMPVAQYRREDYRKELVAAWQKLHHTRHGVVHITKALAVPEPLGAYYYYGNDYDPANAILQKQVTFLDGGYFTFDWITAARGHLVDSQCDSTNVGAYRLLKLLQSKLKARIDLVRLEAAVISGQPITVKGKQVSLDGPLRESLAIVCGELAGELRSKLGEANGTDEIFVCGGSGAMFMDGVRQAFPEHKVTLLEQAQRANAIGYYYIAQNL